MATEFDYAQLDAITGGDAEFEKEVLEEYLLSAPNDVGKLKHAITAGDAATVGATAHALKGASATIGAKGFAAIALELEQAGKKADLSAAPDTFSRLEAAFTELTGLLRERIAKAA
ncbi:MAG: Hpt domain-containing protein [Candidatus Eisenbacteria bacterium]|uniref:Hpt domain-containing protein n=1 Tax=Eiseniibacteriota bacterium TaxID=2212470 RepID=A0A933W0I2_UNCEI|nr:Hpt domain-containing protein [Candidatus Eisenbacteria bacterium]